MQTELKQELSKALDSEVRAVESLSGGDINETFEVLLADERRVFVKTNQHALPGMFRAESRGLAWLRAARALATPQVLAVQDGKVPFLVLELLERRGRVPDFDEQLGRGLATLHRSGADGFGLEYSNYIGRLHQGNVKADNWVEFYRSQRLEYQINLARESGNADAELLRAFDRLIAKLPQLVGPDEKPSRLHGDLWSGNVHVDKEGKPCLIDPAVYGGHREMDLAMMRLFGGFTPRVYAAYNEDFPLAEGSMERIALYQLYPLLVHLNLFGSGYRAQLLDAVKNYL